MWDFQHAALNAQHALDEDASVYYLQQELLSTMMFDQSFPLGKAPEASPISAYLDIAQIIQIAKVLPVPQQDPHMMCHSPRRRAVRTNTARVAPRELAARRLAHCHAV